MRKIGEFNEQKSALRFWNYLKAQGIDSSLEEEEDDFIDDEGTEKKGDDESGEGGTDEDWGRGQMSRSPE